MKRLPLAGTAPQLPVVPIRAPRDRLDLTSACVAVAFSADPAGAEAFAQALLEALGDGGRRVRVEAADLDRVEELVAGAGVAVVVGNLLAAVARPTLTVMITGGASPATWHPSARALRDRLDLELADPRPGVARALASGLAAATAEPR